MAEGAGRLIITESAFFSSASQRDCFNDLDVEQYEIVATLDGHTSETCRSMDGKVLPMKDYKPGVTAPPFHVNCRSTTVPYFDDEFTVGEERAARDEDGQYYTVPADMKYEDWEKVYVSKELTMAEWQESKKSKTKVEESSTIKTSKAIFTPASTIAEADAFLKFLGIEGKYEKGRINLDVANTINKAIADAIDIFGNNNLLLRSISKWPKKDGDFVACYSRVFGDIFLRQCGSKDTLKRLLKDTTQNFEYGCWSTDDIAHFIRHELGHALHSGIGKNARRTELEKLFNEARANIRWGKYGYHLDDYLKAGMSPTDYINDLKEAGKTLSAYGLRDVDEMVAEAVAEYMNGEPREFAQKVVNTLMGW